MSLENSSKLLDICPPFGEFLFPTLKFLSDEKVKSTSEIREAVASQMKLSEKAKLETVKSGKSFKYVNRIHWASTYLRQAGLITTPKWGSAQITPNGIEFLKNNPYGIKLSKLDEIPEFIEFKNRRRETVSYDVSENNLTPDNTIEKAVKDTEDDLSTQILENLRQNSPAFFEKAIVDVLIAMGYGLEGAGRVVGQPGDNGIDGIIDQDHLGLDRIYIQAKRHENNVSSGNMRDFTGSLAYHQASKGLFVTTAQFSEKAKDTAEKVEKRIVLIDGEKLSRLMIEYEVGCTSKKTVAIKQIDRDYFDA